MNEDFLDLLSALSAADARFLIVGAYAVGVHGRPRATKDLDVCGRLRGPGNGLQGGRAVRCGVIGLSDLMTNKRAAGRPQDLADVAALERLARLKKG